jgi:anti-anti-sigma regulatory factor
MDIIASENLYKNLNKAISQNNGNILIDASKVERITTPCLQLIISAVKELGNSDRTISVSEASDKFIECTKILGLTNYISMEGV